MSQMGISLKTIGIPAGATGLAAWMLALPAMAMASDGAAQPVIAPLPSSALMGALLLGGIAAFARFPTHKQRRRRRRSAVQT